MMAQERQRIRWPEIVERVKDILDFFEGQDVKPTLRAVFYRLVAENTLPNTVSNYQALSRNLVKARKEGTIAFDALEDRGRYSIQNFSDVYLTEGDLDSVQKMCSDKIEDMDLDYLLDSYFSGLSLSMFDEGFWARQPVIPEIWVEKDAIAPTIEKWVSDLSTNIRVNRGYGGWSFLHTNIQELKETLSTEDHEKAVIFYVGDLDPSGTDMDRHLVNVLKFFDMADKVEFRRLALLPQQVTEYNLPPKPEDAETLAKVARDPRSKKYELDYIVEVDAFLGLAPEAFKALIRAALHELHDEAISEDVQKNNRELSQMAWRIRENAIAQAKAILLAQLNGGSAR